MRNILCRVSALLLALLLCLSMCPVSAAEDVAFEPVVVPGDSGAVRAVIPVTLRVSGSAPSKERSYFFRLTPLEGAPDPVIDEENGVGIVSDVSTGETFWQMTITGSGEFETTQKWTVPLTRVGTYHYQVAQVRGDYSRCRYDQTVYEVTITVTNAYDQQGNDLDMLQATIVARVSGAKEDTKTDVVYHNRYSSPSHEKDDPKPKPETPEKTYLEVDKVWSGTSKTRPGSVTIQLLDGNTILDTVTLGDWNNWHYSWHDLDGSGSHDWNVKELEVPEGYSVSYSFDGTTFTVRNTETLIQTGQLNWPVPVLGAAGLALVVAGLLMLRKKKES